MSEQYNLICPHCNKGMLLLPHICVTEGPDHKMTAHMIFAESLTPKKKAEAKKYLIALIERATKGEY